MMVMRQEKDNRIIRQYQLSCKYKDFEVFRENGHKSSG